jgi:hypothetical protein
MTLLCPDFRLKPLTNALGPRPRPRPRALVISVDLLLLLPPRLFRLPPTSKGDSRSFLPSENDLTELYLAPASPVRSRKARKVLYFTLSSETFNCSLLRNQMSRSGFAMHAPVHNLDPNHHKQYCTILCRDEDVCFGHSSKDARSSAQ